MAKSREDDDDDDPVEVPEEYDPTEPSSFVRLQALMMVVCEVGLSQRICIAFL